jgi:hypothetical protein
MRKNHDDLLALEKKFWSGDSAFFAANADAECLVAFPDMAGVMENADLAKTAKNPRRWKDLEIELKGVIEPSDDVTLLSYEADATRENGEHYKALVSTGYKKHRDGWKMMFHGQTPLEGSA